MALTEKDFLLSLFKIKNITVIKSIWFSSSQTESYYTLWGRYTISPLVAVIFLGQQVYEGIAVQNNISNMAHIVGGIVGATFGYFLNKKIFAIKFYICNILIKPHKTLYHILFPNPFLRAKLYSNKYYYFIFHVIIL